MPKKRTKRGGRPSRLAQLSVADLMRELDRRKRLFGAMERTRAGLVSELAAVDAQIAGLQAISDNGQVRGPRRGRRAKPGKGGRDQRRGRRDNSLSLPSVLQKLLRGRTMGVAEMAQAAKKAGYKSKSKAFQKVVALKVLNRKLFRRVGRGQYTAK